MKRLMACVVAIVAPVFAQAQADDPSVFVHTLYRTILQRQPSRSEVELWTRSLLAGMKSDEARASFLGSDEFYRLHDKDARKFVVAAFEHAFGRPAAYEELKHWGGRYWELKQDRVALSLEMIRAVPRYVLPAEPLAVAQPHRRFVAQVEIGVVVVELYLNGVAAFRGRPGVAGLEEQGRALAANLARLRRSAGGNQPYQDLHVQLRLSQDDLLRLRERHRQMLSSAPSLPLPSLVEVVDAVDGLPPLLQR